jgi:hypothetical protein
MYQLVWDDADPTSETMPSKVVKANYTKLADAKHQAEHDIALGKRIIGIAKDDKFVWVADDHQDKKDHRLDRVTLSNGRVSWNFVK